jgi:hypothetical protein
MKVDGNKGKGVNKETIEGNQIAPKTKERLLNATLILC